MKKNKTLFIGLYDSKLLGIRYLSSYLLKEGYDSNMLFIKSFNSHNTKEPTETEFNLIYDLIEKMSPDIIGISIMCSFYLDVAKKITKDIKKRFNTTVVCGGAYATLFPQVCLEDCDMVIRGEGEDAWLELVNAISKNESVDGILNLAYKKDGEIIQNEIRPLVQDLDTLPFPDLGGSNKYYINNDKCVNEDPEISSFSYEMTASRGCPNRCSYCATSSIRELYKGKKGKFIRLRSPENVVNEMKEAKEKMPNLQMLRLWDEIFPWDEDWIDKFSKLYKKEINLPFEAWGHPRYTKLDNMKKLADAGLQKMVIGIQSGSDHVRKEIYLRNESRECIIECSRIMSEAKVPIVIYDFILNHPFETPVDLEETLNLCMEMKKPFTLQLHGLSFLPGTAIEDIAVKRNVKTWDDIHAEQSKPLAEQYRAMHWWRIGKGESKNSEQVYWHSLIYLSQFKKGEKIVKWALKKETLKQNPSILLTCQKLFNNVLMFKMGTRKLKFMLGIK